MITITKCEECVKNDVCKYKLEMSNIRDNSVSIKEFISFMDVVNINIKCKYFTDKKHVTILKEIN